MAPNTSNSSTSFLSARLKGQINILRDQPVVFSGILSLPCLCEGTPTALKGQGALGTRGLSSVFTPVDVFSVNSVKSREVPGFYSPGGLRRLVYVRWTFIYCHALVNLAYDRWLIYWDNLASYPDVLRVSAWEARYNLAKIVFLRFSISTLLRSCSIRDQLFQPQPVWVDTVDSSQ